jgi:lipopolysaccharide export system permease protein
MRLLTRYVLFEIIKVFLITLTAMTLFMILVMVSKEAYSQGLGLKQILLLVPYVLPESMRYSVPGTILFAACSVYGRMASTNEVVAIKAMGISPLVILVPTFVFAFVLSLVCVVLNDVACSWGREGARRVVIESVQEIIYSKLAQQRHYDSKQFGINVKRVDGKRLIRPTFTFSSADDSPPVTITCEEAELRSDLHAATLTIVGLNGTVDVGGAGGFIPGTFERVLQLDEASRRATKGASDLPMSQVPSEVKVSQDRIAQIQQKMALLAAEQMSTGDFSGLAGSQWAADERRMDEERVRLYRLLIEPSRRWANGFSCLCFVLLGAPAGIILRNSDFLTSFFACFLPILLIYYPLLFLGVDQAKLGILPAWSVWIGNAILAVCGAWLIRRVQRY